MSYEMSSDYVDTLTFFDPTLGIAFENKPQATTQIHFQSEVGIVSYNSTVMMTDNSTFSNFFTNFDNLTLNYYDGNITYEQLTQAYFAEVDSAKGKSSYIKQIIGASNEDGLSITLNKTDEITPVYLITLIDQWNVSESFIYEASISIDYIIHRNQALIEGGILDAIGVLLIIIDQTLAFRDDRKKKKTELTDKT